VTWVLALGAAACGGAGVVSVPVVEVHVVEVPAPREEASSAPAPACPPDTLAENGVCVRVVASPEIPAWEAPHGHGDPCATWTSEKGLWDCDAKNEDAARADAGARAKKAGR
jgi:hypothetical protein